MISNLAIGSIFGIVGIIVFVVIYYLIVKKTPIQNPPAIRPPNVPPVIQPPISPPVVLGNFLGISNGSYYSAQSLAGPWIPVIFNNQLLTNPWIMYLKDKSLVSIGYNGNNSIISTSGAVDGSWKSVYDTSVLNIKSDNIDFLNISQLNNSTFVATSNFPTDNGGNLLGTTQAVSLYGACDEKLWPYNINKQSTQPPMESYNKAIFPTSSWLNVKPDINSMKTCLANGLTFMAGIMLYNSFMTNSVATSGMVPMPTILDKTIGGHAVMCVGYTSINGSNYWIMRNSWGTGWGDKGYFYLPEKYLLTPSLVTDFWCLN